MPAAWRPVRNNALLSQWSGAPGLRQWQRNPPKALSRQFQVVPVEVHPYAAPAQPLGHGAGGTRADEGVQHQPARRTTGQDTGFHQCFGEGGVMGSRVILGSDGLHLRPHWDRGENGRRGLFPGRPTPDLPAAGEGGKHHTVPAHHNAIEYVEDSLDAAGLWTTPRAPLFQSVARSRRQLNGRRLPEDNALQMIKRRAGRAGLSATTCCHTFRATGITNYLENGVALETSRALAAHQSSQTTRLYDHSGNKVSLDEIERIRI